MTAATIAGAVRRLDLAMRWLDEAAAAARAAGAGREADSLKRAIRELEAVHGRLRQREARA